MSVVVLVVATLCLYNKYCLSVRYENDCNEKRGRLVYLLTWAQQCNGHKQQQNAAVEEPKEKKVDGKNLSLSLSLDYVYIFCGLCAHTHKQHEEIKQLLFCLGASGVIKYGNSYQMG